MNELAFLTRTAIADGPRHGYGILREVESMTGGEARPQVATLYRTIERLAAADLLVEHDSEVVDGRFRRRYRLSDAGAAQLAQEAKLRSATARIATRRLRHGAPRPGLAGGTV